MVPGQDVSCSRSVFFTRALGRRERGQSAADLSCAVTPGFSCAECVTRAANSRCVSSGRERAEAAQPS